MQIPHPEKRVRDDRHLLWAKIELARRFCGFGNTLQFSTNFMGPIVVQISGANFRQSLIAIVAPKEDC
jgi:hypothetical protein